MHPSIQPSSQARSTDAILRACLPFTAFARQRRLCCRNRQSFSCQRLSTITFRACTCPRPGWSPETGGGDGLHVVIQRSRLHSSRGTATLCGLRGRCSEERKQKGVEPGRHVFETNSSLPPIYRWRELSHVRGGNTNSPWHICRPCPVSRSPGPDSPASRLFRGTPFHLCCYGSKSSPSVLP